MTLGDIIKKYRQVNDISMDEFAKRSNLSKGYISMLENNINPRNNKPIAPTLPTIKKIATGMNVDVDTILKMLDSDQAIVLDEDEFSHSKQEKTGIGRRIKAARNALNLTQEELAKLLGVTKGAVANYENETSHPKVSVMYKMFSALNVDANYLFQDVVNIPIRVNDVTLSEFEHIKKYRALDPRSQKIIDFVLTEEYERMVELQQSIPEKDAESNLLYLDYYRGSASAGSGIYHLDEYADRIPVIKTNLSNKADFVIDVSGNSMSPLFCDADKVFVTRHETVEIGDIGVFAKDGDIFIKQRGEKELISLNKKWPNVLVNEFNTFACYGKVIGKLTDDGEPVSITQLKGDLCANEIMNALNTATEKAK